MYWRSFNIEERKSSCKQLPLIKCQTKNVDVSKAICDHRKCRKPHSENTLWLQRSNQKNQVINHLPSIDWYNGFTYSLAHFCFHFDPFTICLRFTLVVSKKPNKSYMHMRCNLMWCDVIRCDEELWIKPNKNCQLTFISHFKMAILTGVLLKINRAYILQEHIYIKCVSEDVRRVWFSPFKRKWLNIEWYQKRESFVFISVWGEVRLAIVECCTGFLDTCMLW